MCRTWETSVDATTAKAARSLRCIAREVQRDSPADASQSRDRELSADRGGVWNYLNSGSAHPPRASLGSKVVLCSPAQSISLESLEKLLLKAKHGAHGVLTVNPGVENQEHNVNVVNIHGTIYLVDAFNKEPVMAKNWRDYLQYGKTFEFSWEWRVFVVPDDQLSGFRCPVPATTPPNKAPNAKHGNSKQPAKH
jgi:hypothetical protein